MEAKEKRNQKFENYEQASLVLLGEYIKECEDQKKVKDYKVQIAEEIEKKRMENSLKVPEDSNLQSMTRLEWNRQRVMYFFKKQEEEKQSENSNDIFDLRIKRKFISKKEKEKKFDEERKKYNERFEKGPEFESEFDPESNRESNPLSRHASSVEQPNPTIPRPAPVRTHFEFGDDVPDMDDLVNRKNTDSDDSFFIKNSPKSSKKSSVVQSNVFETASFNFGPSVSKEDLDFDKMLKAEFSKIDKEGGTLKSVNISTNLNDEEVKPILEDEKVKNRKYIPTGYFERKNRPKIRRSNRNDEVNVYSSDEEEDKFEREAMRFAEDIQTNTRSDAGDWHTNKTNLELVFEEPLDSRMRRSRDTVSQMVLSLGEEDLGSNRVIFDWLNKEDIDIGEVIFNEDDNSLNEQSQTNNLQPKPTNLLEFFSGGFLREGEDEGTEQVGKNNARIHKIRREFVESRAPRASEQDRLTSLKSMLAAMGVSWIDSPSEAEAQCAQLEIEGIAQGSVTDDCDSLLFGSKRVFRGLFGQGKTAEQFKAEKIESDLGLDREQLVMLALFLGCDYCLGIRGVGIVNAVEIVDAYSSIDALARFKKWAAAPDYWISKEIYQESKENYPKEYSYMEKHKNYKKEWELPSDFPNEKVIDAFYHPQVKKNLSDHLPAGTAGLKVDAMLKFARDHFRLDDRQMSMIEEPLKKELARRQNPNLDQFFRPVENKVTINSSRLQTSLANLRVKRLDQSVADFIVRQDEDSRRTATRLSQEGLLPPITKQKKSRSAEEEEEDIQSELSNRRSKK